MKIAAAQMVSTPDVQANLQAARTLIRRAADSGAQLVALPEYFCLMGQHDHRLSRIEYLYRPATHHNVWMLCTNRHRLNFGHLRDVERGVFLRKVEADLHISPPSRQVGKLLWAREQRR